MPSPRSRTCQCSAAAPSRPRSPPWAPRTTRCAIASASNPTQKPVGASLLAMRPYQSPSTSPDTPPREQAHSHRWDPRRSQMLWSPKIPCGSGLAREEALIFNINPTERPCLQAQTTFSPTHSSNLLSNTTKRDLIPAFHISGTGKRYFRGQKSPAIHPHNP